MSLMYILDLGFYTMNYYPVGQTESHAYEPTVQHAQVGSKKVQEKSAKLGINRPLPTQKKQVFKKKTQKCILCV